MTEEEARIQKQGGDAAMYIQTEGWNLVKEIFQNEIMDLQSIKNLDSSKPDELLADIRARNTAIDILMKVIRLVEGKAEQFKNNRVPDAPTGDIITRL